MDIFFFFFFQAEDGIRDYKVTGVQTCALPISRGDGSGRALEGRAGRWADQAVGRHRGIRGSAARPGPRAGARGERSSRRGRGPGGRSPLKYRRLVNWKKWPAALFRTVAPLPPAKGVTFAGCFVPGSYPGLVCASLASTASATSRVERAGVLPAAMSGVR